MKILVTGATGLVGQRLLQVLATSGHSDIRVLSRDKERAQSVCPSSVQVFSWDIQTGSIDRAALDGVEVVIHLAGENVAAGRWTSAKKQRILQSRERGSQLLVKSIQQWSVNSRPPKKLISASAVGIYGPRGEEKINTQSSLGDDFLAQVCKSWENSILHHRVEGMQAHCIRTGVVLSSQGGALQKMLPPFRMGVGGKLGSGQQYMSWIHVDDLVRQFIFLIERDGKSPVYNGTAPHPVSNLEFTKTLGSVLGRPTLFPVPSFVLKVVLGEMSDMLLRGQRVFPEQFLQEGLQFQFPELRAALEDILR